MAPPCSALQYQYHLLSICSADIISPWRTQSTWNHHGCYWIDLMLSLLSQPWFFCLTEATGFSVLRNREMWNWPWNSEITTFDILKSINENYHGNYPMPLIFPWLPWYTFHIPPLSQSRQKTTYQVLIWHRDRSHAPNSMITYHFHGVILRKPATNSVVGTFLFPKPSTNSMVLRMEEILHQLIL